MVLTPSLDWRRFGVFLCLVTPSAPKHSAGEVTEIELVPLDQLADQVTSGKIRVAVHIAALYYMLGQPVAD